MNLSGMIGSVTVMEPPAYQTWLACNTCHLDTWQGRGPSLKDTYGKPVELADASTVTVNEAYLRESILHSQAKIVKGVQAGATGAVPSSGATRVRQRQKV